MKSINPMHKAPIPEQAQPRKGVASVLMEGTPPEIIDLIEKLLEYEPHKRITAKEALQHPFFALVHGRQSQVRGKRQRNVRRDKS